MFGYLAPHDGPVFDGLEDKEIVYAKDQSQYIPLRTLVSAGADKRVISRWTLTPEQREAVAKGADIYLELMTYGHPLQPIRMIVTDGKMKGEGPLSTDWVKVYLLDEAALGGKDVS